MKRRSFISQSVALGAVAQAPRIFGVNLKAGRKPNLLFVFSDQQAYDTIRAHGLNDQVITPNLDAFAAESVDFSSAISSNPVCTPFRGMLMSGQHPLWNGCVRNDWRLMPGHGNHFGEVLKANGYRTAYVGKWHLAGGYRDRPVPAGWERHGFDEFISNNCHCDFLPEHSYYWDRSGNKVMFKEWEQVGQTRQAMQFLDSCCADDPFALFVSWHPPHNHAGQGYPAPAKWEKQYDAETLKLRPGVEDTPRNREMWKGHLALVSSVDECFGMLMQKLKEKGLDDNTIVVFTSDHGDLVRYVGEHRLMKMIPHPLSTQIPFMVRWPGQLPPRKSDLMIGPMDMMPTLLGMMKLPVPDQVQGRDLSDAIVSKNDHAVESVSIFNRLRGGWYGVCTADYVYSFIPEGAPDEPYAQRQLLIDRRNDPFGARNLFGDPDHADVQARMHALTLNWMRRFGDAGVPYEVLEKNCLVFGRYDYRDPAFFGAQKGRPIDMIHDLNLKGSVEI